MAVDIKSLLSPLVKRDVLADLYTLLGLLLGYPLELQDGAPIPAILDAVIGLIVDKLWNPLVLPALRAVYFDYSTGDWLSLIAALIVNRPRILAQAATGPLIVENRGAIFSGTIAAGQIRTKNSVTGKTYTNTTGGPLAAWVGGDYPTVTLTFEADEAGTASSAQPGDISTTPVSAPSGVVVRTNGSAFLGSDFEADPSLVTRARAAPGGLSSSGPRKAYLDAALDPVGALTRRRLPVPSSWGTAAPAILRVRVVDSAPAWTALTAYVVGMIVLNGGRLFLCITSGTSASSGGPTGTAANITDGSAHWKFLGHVAVFLASASGPAGGDNATLDTDVFKANFVIQLVIVPPGVTCYVGPAVEQDLALGTITLDVSAESLVTVDEAIATATANLEAFFSTLPIAGARKAGTAQGYVFASKVFGVCEQGGGVVAAFIPALSADVLANASAVIVPSFTLAANIVTQGA